MTKSELERRAAEMRARNLAARSREKLPVSAPAVIVAPTSIPIKRKIRLQESLADVDFFRRPSSTEVGQACRRHGDRPRWVD